MGHIFRACYACYDCSVSRVISQREMRNRSGEVLRAVTKGESFIITNDGVEVAELIPRFAGRQRPQPERPATAPKGTPFPLREVAGPSTLEVLQELREERTQN